MGSSEPVFSMEGAFLLSGPFQDDENLPP